MSTIAFLSRHSVSSDYYFDRPNLDCALAFSGDLPGGPDDTRCTNCRYENEIVTEYFDCIRLPSTSFFVNAKSRILRLTAFRPSLRPFLGVKSQFREASKT